jgi:hypothetical protein
MGRVISEEPFANVVCANSDTCIRAGVIRRFAPQQVDPNEAFFQFVNLVIECVVNDVSQELAALGACPKGLASADIVQGLLQLRDVAANLGDLDLLLLHRPTETNFDWLKPKARVLHGREEIHEYLLNR